MIGIEEENEAVSEENENNACGYKDSIESYILQKSNILEDSNQQNLAPAPLYILNPSSIIGDTRKEPPRRKSKSPLPTGKAKSPFQSKRVKAASVSFPMAHRLGIAECSDLLESVDTETVFRRPLIDQEQTLSFVWLLSWNTATKIMSQTFVYSGL